MCTGNGLKARNLSTEIAHQGVWNCLYTCTCILCSSQLRVSILAQVSTSNTFKIDSVYNLTCSVAVDRRQDKTITATAIVGNILMLRSVFVHMLTAGMVLLSIGVLCTAIFRQERVIIHSLWLHVISDMVEYQSILRGIHMFFGGFCGVLVLTERKWYACSLLVIQFYLYNLIVTHNFIVIIFNAT